MVGLTYTALSPGNFCYIVVAAPATVRGEWEFLEGIVDSVKPAPKEIPSNHPLWRYLQKPPRKVQSIVAKVIDPKAMVRNPIDPIRINHEPGRHYLVVDPREQGRYNNQVLEYVVHLLEQRENVNAVQYNRIIHLEAELQRYQGKR